MRRPDHSTAVRWFTRAAEAGLAAAQYNLGVACWRGGWLENVPDADPVHTGSSYAEKVVDEAGASAVYNMRDHRNSSHRFHGASSKGDRNETRVKTKEKPHPSRAERPSSSSRKHVVPPNAAVAVGWFEKAAMQGDAQAQYNLAGCYKNGEVKRIRGLFGGAIGKVLVCLFLFLRDISCTSCEFVHSQHDFLFVLFFACLYYSFLFSNDFTNEKGVPRCMGLACYWWSRAAACMPDAAANLGAALWNGEVPAQPYSGSSSRASNSDESEKAARRAAAVGWYRCAAEQGHAVAQRHLADALLTSAAANPAPTTSASSSSAATSSSSSGGSSTSSSRNSSSSSSGSSSSSSSGSRSQMNTLPSRYTGMAATEGTAEESNLSEGANAIAGDQTLPLKEPEAQHTPSLEAAKWYAAAADQGDAPAAYSLGVLYETGLGSNAPDLERATEWHQLAARLGFRASEESLATLVPALAASKNSHASSTFDAHGLSQPSIEEEEEELQSPSLLQQSQRLLSSPTLKRTDVSIEKGWLTAEEAAKSMAAALAKIRLAES